MRINNLVLYNITSYQGRHEIDFDIPILKNSELFLISGHTGSGKSTILDCITLGLYAQVYRLGRSISDSISKGKDSGYVKLIFTISDRQYESFIELSIKNKETPKIMIFKSLSEDIVIEGRENVLNYIKQLCRLDFRQFCQTVILPQGNFQEFLTASPSSKTAIIDNIFNLDKYDRISEYIKIELELNKNNKINLEKDLEREQQDLWHCNERIKILDLNLSMIGYEGLAKKLVKVNKYISFLENLISCFEELFKLEDQQQELQEVIKGYEQELIKINLSYENNFQIIQKLKNQLLYYQGENFLKLKHCIKQFYDSSLNELEQCQIKFHKLNTKVCELQELHLELDSFDYLKRLYHQNLSFKNVFFDEEDYEAFSLKEKELINQKLRLTKELEQQNLKIFNENSSKDNFNFEKYIYYKALELNKISNEQQKELYFSNTVSLLLQLKEKNFSIDLENLSHLDDYDLNDLKEFIKISSELAIYRKVVSDIEQRNKDIEDNLHGLSYLENDFKNYQYKEFNKIENLKKLNRLNSKLETILKDIEQVRIVLIQKTEEKLRYQVEQKSFEQKNLEILERLGEKLFRKHIDYENEDKLKNLEIKISQFESLKLQLKEHNVELKLRSNQLEEDFVIIQDLIRQLNLNIDSHTYERLEAEFSVLLVKIQKLEALLRIRLLDHERLSKGKIQMEGQLKLLVSNLNKMVSTLNTHKCLLTSNLIGFTDLLRNDKLNNKQLFEFEYNLILKNDKSLKRNTMNEYDNFKKLLCLESDFLKKSLAEYKIFLRDLDILKNEKKIKTEYIKGLNFSFSKLQHKISKLEVIKKVVSTNPTLKYYVQSYIMKELINLANHRYLYFMFPYFQLCIDMNSKELNFLIEDMREENHSRGIKTLSGGERFLVSLSIALSLSDMLRDSDLKIESFFLDEGFGNLDEMTLREIIPKISEFQRITGRQIGIISHVSYLKELITTQIIVNKISKTSRIQVQSF